jgi:hypothetical protein
VQKVNSMVQPNKEETTAKVKVKVNMSDETVGN